MRPARRPATLVSLIIAAALTSVCSTPATRPVYSGTFQIEQESIQYEGWLKELYRLVLVTARARYIGEVDLNDNNYLIQTFLNDSVGDDLDDWAYPDWAGAGSNGEVEFTGQIISCTGGCTGNGDITRPRCGSQSVQYKGKAGVTIYHQITPEIDVKYGSERTVECREAIDSPDPSSCEAASWQSRELVLTLAGEEIDRIQSSNRQSERIGRVDQGEADAMTYLLDEWAIVRHEPLAGYTRVRVPNASSRGFALTTSVRMARRFEQRRPGNEGWNLVILEPEHPENDRWIPLPTVSLGAGAPTGLPRGKVAVRIDVAPEQAPRRLEILWSDQAGFDPAQNRADAHDRDGRVSEPVSRHSLFETWIDEHLQIDFIDERRHRVVVFAIVEFGAGWARLVDAHASLPRCCCLGPECPI